MSSTLLERLPRWIDIDSSRYCYLTQKLLIDIYAFDNGRRFGYFYHFFLYITNHECIGGFQARRGVSTLISSASSLAGMLNASVKWSTIWGYVRALPLRPQLVHDVSPGRSIGRNEGGRAERDAVPSDARWVEWYNLSLTKYLTKLPELPRSIRFDQLSRWSYANELI